MHKSTFLPSFHLRRMEQLLLESGWCQHHMAQDSHGTPCFVEDRDASYFGLVGAFYWVRDKYPQTLKYEQQAIEMILKVLNRRKAAEGKVKSPSDIIKDRASKTDEWKFHFNSYNDSPGRTKAEILGLLREAMDA